MFAHGPNSVSFAYSESFFHEACFKCSRCRGQIFVVDGATNPLLLSDGSLVCSYCHYDCDACQLPLTDEAIVAGDNKYHPHCFQCKACASNIEGLVFAKTSRGIYCMDCHNKRIAKFKENAQRKAEAEQTAAS